MAGVVQAMQVVRDRIAEADVRNLDGNGIAFLLEQIQQTDRSLTALKIRAGQQADALAAGGNGPGAEEAFRRSNNDSASTRRRNCKRSKIVDDIPELGDALDGGTIGGEHLDAIARAANRVDHEARPMFDTAAADLIERSADIPVDTFNKQAQRLADTINNDHGLAQARAQRDASELSMWTDRNGMGHLRGSFDPQRFASLRNAIQQEAAARASAARAVGDPVTKGGALGADALIELVQHGNGAKGRSDVVVVIDHETFSAGPHDHSIRQTKDGADLAYDTIDRLCCDALIRRVVIDADGVRPSAAHRHVQPVGRPQRHVLQVCLAQLRPAGVMVPSPSHPRVGTGRRHRPRQPRASLLHPPPRSARRPMEHETAARPHTAHLPTGRHPLRHRHT